MNATFSTHRKFKRMFANLLSCFVILTLVFPLAGSASAQEPNPRIVASLTHNWFQAEHFTPDSTLTLDIFDTPDGSLLWSETRTADGSGLVFVGEWEHPVDLVPGNSIVVSDGVTSKDLELEPVTLDVFDPSADYLAGTAPATPGGRFVWVGTGNQNYGCSMDVIADPDSGAWTADFSTQTCDVTEDMWGAAQVFDADGDASEANPPPPPPNPHFTVFPEWEWFDGWDWPDGVMVSITVDGKEECTTTGQSSGNFFNGSFGTDCNVVVGDVVTFTDGTTVRTHTVRSLAVTEIDPENETIRGTADSGADVFVWPHETGEQQKATADGDGNWQVDFTGIFDLAPGKDGRSQVYDETGNATAVDWHVLNPRFEVRDEADSVAGWDWLPDTEVSISVDGAFLTTAQTDEWGYFNTVVSELLDIVPGMSIEVTDEASVKMHLVSSLSITGVDVDTEIVSGVGTSGRRIQVDVCEPDRCVQRWETASEDDTWVANFSIPGDEPGEEQTIDVVPGTWIDSREWDEDGDNTVAGYYIRNPRFVVFPEWEFFDGHDWPDGATVSISVENKPECATQKESSGYFFNGNFPEGCDVVIGDAVNFTDATTTRTHVVRNLDVTTVNVDDDTITGIGDAGTVVYVWPHDGWFEPLQAIADDLGVWQVDLGDVGYDLQAGSSGRSEIRDDLGNATAVDWYVPYPHFSVFPEWEAVEGYEWPDGATVTASIAGNEACVTEGVAGYPEWDPWNTFVSMNFPEGCDVQPGHVVTLTDGVTTLTHTVYNLAISGVDALDDLVFGTADEDALVNVWPHATGQQVQVTAPAGIWQVDFTDMFDVIPGESGRAEIRDLLRNATAVDWYAPNPHIVASITEDWFYLQEFAPNALINFSIYETVGGSPLWEGTATTDDSGHLWVDAEGRWDLVPGSVVVASDGTSMRDLVIEGFTFDVFDVTRGLLKGTAPEPFGRRIWVGIGWENDIWAMDVNTNRRGAWRADFDSPIPNGYQWVAAQIFDMDGDATELRPARIIDRTVTAGNFYVEWSTTNPEEIVDLRWKDSVNLTNTFGYSDSSCPEDLEFFGNSWVSENEGAEPFFFASLVGWGTTGTWKEQPGTRVKIGSKSSGCPGSAEVPIKTDYRFFSDALRANLMVVQRMFKFGDIPYVHDVRPFIPRLYPSDGFTEVLHPNATGDELVTDTTCDLGCLAESWNGSWFAIHNPTTGVGMIVQRKPSPYAAALWLDDDDGSFTNASSILLLQPEGGFTGAVTETEYLCFYDSTIWTPSLTLPSGCRP